MTVYAHLWYYLTWRSIHIYDIIWHDGLCTSMILSDMTVYAHLWYLTWRSMHIYDIIWHDGLCTSMILSCWILLRIRNVSGKIRGENQNTYFRFIASFVSVCSGIRKTYINLWTCRLHMTPSCHLHTSDRRLQMCYGLPVTLQRQRAQWLSITPSKGSTTEVCIWGWKKSRLPKRSALIIQHMLEKL